MSATVTTEIFIQRARAIHGDRYDYSKVEYVNAKTKVCILCPDHGVFWQRPHVHFRGAGCPRCGIDKVKTSKSSNLDLFILRARVIHGDRYDYSKVNYINAKTKVLVICPDHGEFSIKPDNFLSLGQGCPKCGIIKRQRTQSKDLADFVLEAQAVHNNKYTYDHVVYVNGKTKVSITCPIHGDFLQTPTNHLKGKGCPYCSGNAKKWDERSCKEAAGKYKYLADFRRLVPGAWRIAQENGWIESYNLKKLPPKNIDYSKSYRYIYAYEFTTYNAVYVGLTNSLIRRDWEHHNGLRKSPVYKFANEKKCEIPSLKILEKNVPVMESGEREHFWEEKYIQEGWDKINIAKTGKVSSSLGATRSLKWTEKSIRIKAKECNYNIKIFTEKYSGAREAITTRYPYLLEELFSDRKIHTHHTTDEAINTAKSLQCKNRNQLRGKCNWAFRILGKNHLLDHLYPIPHYEFSKDDAIAQARTYRSIESIRRQNRPLWKYLKDNDLFKEACPTDIMFHRCKTPEEAWDLSLHYNSLSEFCLHARTAYYILKDSGLLHKRFGDKRFNKFILLTNRVSSHAD